MTHSNPVSSKCSNSSHLADQKKLLENQYWSRPASKSSEASARTGLLKQLGSWLLTLFADTQ